LLVAVEVEVKVETGVMDKVVEMEVEKVVMKDKNIKI
jgi:hypothetical protein